MDSIPFMKIKVIATNHSDYNLQIDLINDLEPEEFYDTVKIFFDDRHRYDTKRRLDLLGKSYIFGDENECTHYGMAEHNTWYITDTAGMTEKVKMDNAVKAVKDFNKFLTNKIHKIIPKKEIEISNTYNVGDEIY